MPNPERYGHDEIAPIDTYQEWQEAQGIPRITGFYVEDIRSLPLAPWNLKGGRGAFINLDGTGGVTDAYVCEIPAGGKLNPQKHLYEEMVYVIQGSGATEFWQGEGKRHAFEWCAGGLFAIPLNACYQHFNRSGSEPARYLAVTNAPPIMNLFHNPEFIFNNGFAFTDRFDPDDADYFTRQGRLWGPRDMIVNFVPDVGSIPLRSSEGRGAKGRYLQFDMASQIMLAHISEFPVGTYKKAHRHGPGAHVIILSGQGYSLLWPDGGTRVRVDWKPGSLFVPPNQWFHQHFNLGADQARYLALRSGGQGRFVVPALFATPPAGAPWFLRAAAIVCSRIGWRSMNRRLRLIVSGLATEGPNQIEYQDEDPGIHGEFEAALSKAGVQCAMGSYHPFCTQR